MFVKGEYLQLDGEIDLSDVNPVGHCENARREVQNARHPGRDQPVGDGLRGMRRRRDHRDMDSVLGHHGLELVDASHDQTIDALAEPSRVRVQQRGDPEPPGHESVVPGQRVAEVADTHQDDGPRLVQPEHRLDLASQKGHVVAHAPGAVAAQVRQVLAEFGGVDPGRARQRVAGHGLVPRVGDVVQRPQILGQPGHGRLRKIGYVRDRLAGRSGKVFKVVLGHRAPCHAARPLDLRTRHTGVPTDAVGSLIVVGARPPSWRRSLPARLAALTD